MKNLTILTIGLVLTMAMASTVSGQEKVAGDTNDPYLWLEEVDGEKALEWVEAQNKITVDILKQHPEFEEINRRTIEIMDSKERIAHPSIRNEFIYNFWKDEKNPRGLWRRTSFDGYFNESPNWETVLDIDALCEEEGEKWAFKGASWLYPDYERCLVRLSRGGSDAVVMREFDLVKKAFIKDGFFLPQAKGGASWIDEDTLLVNTDFGEGTMTDSGYARQTKIWKRGTPLSDATLLFEGEQADVSVGGYVANTPERKYVIVYRGMTFYTAERYVLEDGKLIKLDYPEDAQLNGVFKKQMLIELKSDWDVGGKNYKQGSLISIDYDTFLDGGRNFDVIFEPTERTSLGGVSNTKDFLLVNTLNNVKSELFKYTFVDGIWSSEKVNAPEFGTIGIGSSDDLSNRYFFSFTNFLSPSTLYFMSDGSDESKKIKSLPHFFDSSNLKVEQQEVASKDGTMIPYFVVMAKDAKLDGTNPTLLYGYGGFEISMRPGYSAITGASWLEKGGVYVLANLRGGGEFGPKWHQAGLKENRQRIYDDFFAISEDLIKRKITLPKHLGISGGSNGGLLVGVAFTQRPDLYNAVRCNVPLLDMQRFNKLLAGASWMGEYGNPDIPEEWAYIKKYSPYQNLVETKVYPKVFFTTTTRDDRVHPGHARKMAAKMEGQSHDFFYFENTEGGHGAGVTSKQRALMSTLGYVYMLKMLKD